MKRITRQMERLAAIGLLACGMAISNIGCESPDDIDGGGSKSFTIASFGHPSVVMAVEDPAAQISGFRMSGRSGCSWRNDTDIGAAWGVGRDTIGILVVAGYLRADGQWACAKFDWTRPSNRTRDFNNINSHYNGWDPEAFYAAKRHCFFLMTEDGRRRTNIITD